VENTTRSTSWVRRIAILLGVLAVGLAAGAFTLSRADGPVFVFAGGPLVAGELVKLADMDWQTLDTLHEFELEIVGAESSRTLWFSVTEGAVYVGCDLDCIGGRLTRWPQQIERDARVVVRIDGKRVEGQLIHVPHGSEEYETAGADRWKKYSGAEGGSAAASTAAHATVVEFGEVLTGRASRDEPGDRLYRLDAR
jgi:hypothetical protein